MALSNKFGHLVLTTGNKSELATGYSTLYGDLAGGFAVLKDVMKTLVYELAGWRNASGPTAIPARVFTKPPSAELRPDQLDTDSLPPTSCSIPSSTPTSRRIGRSSPSCAWGSTLASSAGSWRWWTARNTSGDKRRPA